VRLRALQIFSTGSERRNAATVFIDNRFSHTIDKNSLSILYSIFFHKRLPRRFLPHSPVQPCYPPAHGRDPIPRIYFRSKAHPTKNRNKKKDNFQGLRSPPATGSSRLCLDRFYAEPPATTVEARAGDRSPSVTEAVFFIRVGCVHAQMRTRARARVRARERGRRERERERSVYRLRSVTSRAHAEEIKTFCPGSSRDRPRRSRDAEGSGTRSSQFLGIHGRRKVSLAFAYSIAYSPTRL